MKYALFILIVFTMTRPVTGQEVLNNNPPSVKFYKINTPHFKVLYPKAFEKEAQRVANTLEHIYEPEAASMGVKPRKISVILQNQSSVSNGFVSLIPRRSEFYTMPPQDYNFLGTNDWLDQLATHEYRHVVQFQRANTGFNRFLYYAFGPATLAAMATSSVPQWVWEGDAVATETAFTHSGRGRIPNFGLLLRTNLQEGRTFNYNKQYLRSYKHQISDHYVFGYHMIGYLRKHTGDADIWGKAMKRTAMLPFLPFRFSTSVKKLSGLSLPKLYQATALDLQKTWADELSHIQLTNFEPVTKRKSKAYTDYEYPQPLPDGSVVVQKSGIGDFIQFVKITGPDEKKIFIPGIVNDGGMLSSVKDKIVWSEFGFDPRWRVKNYSVIKSYDVSTKKYRVLTHKTRYSGAALSPDTTKIVTVESDTEYTVSLVVISSETGNVLKKFENPSNAFYSMARWSADGSKIVALKTESQKRSVVTIDYASGKETVLIEPSNENIGHPVLTNEYLFYNSPVSGIDNIYALDLKQNVTLQITSAKYGAYNPVISDDGSKIYYNNQSRDGLDVVSIPFSPNAWSVFEKPQTVKNFVDYLVEQEGHPHLLDSVPQQQYGTNRYRKISGIFNPYSWGAYFNSSFTQADIGISTQDVLSTTEIKAGYLFDINERTGAWRLGVSYQGWYPIIDVNIKFANRSVTEDNIPFMLLRGEQLPAFSFDTTYFRQDVNFKWKEQSTEVGLRLPLITTNAKYHGNFSVSNYIGVTRVSDFENSIGSTIREVPYVYRVDPATPLRPSYESFYPFQNYIDNGTLISNRFALSAYRLLKQSRRDINSKFGQAISLNWYSTPFGGDFSGNQFSFYTQLYFPGLFKHHSLWGYWAFQSTDIPQVYSNREAGRNNYLFNNQIPLPRGFSVSRFEKFYSMSANYTLPLWYPDVALGPWLNVQRFRGNAFFDYGFGSTVRTTQVISQTYASVGGELRMDFNFMRYLPQFNVGFRYAYGLQPTVTQFSFLIGLVNF